MRLSFYRLNLESQAGFLIAILVIMIVTFFVDFEAIYYSKTEVPDSVSGRTGYPAGDKVPVVESREEMIKQRYAFTMVVDVAKMKPLRVYYTLNEKSIMSFRFPKFLEGHDDLVHGQFYLVELDNGDTICVLLDDYVLNLSKSGKIKLPRGQLMRTGSTTKKYLVEKSGLQEDNFEYYVDMATEWRKGKEVRECYSMRHFVVTLIFFVIVPPYYIIGWILYRRRTKNEMKV